VTTIAYNLDAETMELNFTADRFIDLEELERVTEAQDNPATTRLISFDIVKPAAAEEPAKLAAEAAPKAKKPSFLDADDEDERAPWLKEEEELPEPVKRPSKKAAAVEPTGSIAAVVSKWGDDEEDDD
jgi:hypothetical protein